jgi:hypothetical protein
MLVIGFRLRTVLLVVQICVLYVTQGLSIRRGQPHCYSMETNIEEQIRDVVVTKAVRM